MWCKRRRKRNRGGRFQRRIAAARLTGNKASDIVLTDPSSQLVYVLLSNGTAFKQTTFSPDGEPANCDAPAAVVLADVNGDGYPDMVLECGAVSNTPIYLNNQEGGFTFDTSLNDVFSNADDFPVVAGVNGDGIADIVTIAGGDIDIFLGEGSGTFEYTASIGTLGSPQDLFALDAHGQKPKSGLPDLVVPDASGVLDVILNVTPSKLQLLKTGSQLPRIYFQPSKPSPYALSSVIPSSPLQSHPVL
jgi:hypothetical protein